MTVILVLVGAWCGFLVGIGATLWWVTRHDPLGGNAPPEEDAHKW